MASTKGTGGSVIILEEAAYIDPNFFYETVAPLTIMGNCCLLAISTLTSSVNFYTRLFQMVDKATGRPMFVSKQIRLSCDACIEAGKSHECVHSMHLIPRWQSSERHIRLKTIMEDRPDLIQSELTGMAFDDLQQIFRSQDIETMLNQPAPTLTYNDVIYIFIDPAAGGPQSDYIVLSMIRYKGMATVSPRPQARTLTHDVAIPDLLQQLHYVFVLVFEPSLHNLP